MHMSLLCYSVTTGVNSYLFLQLIDALVLRPTPIKILSFDVVLLQGFCGIHYITWHGGHYNGTSFHNY